MGRLLFMSATDEELRYGTAQGMDHVTYLLIVYRYGLVCLNNHALDSLFIWICSLSFLLYGYVVFLINVYNTSGRNAANHNSATFNVDSSNMEMTSPGGKWYSRVPSAPHNRGVRQSTFPTHILGEDEDEDEITPRMEMTNVSAGRRT